LKSPRLPSPWASDKTLTADETHVTSDVDANSNTATFAVNLWIYTDGDGIPDDWMMQHFGHPTGQAGDRSRAQENVYVDVTATNRASASASLLFSKCVIY